MFVDEVCFTFLWRFFRFDLKGMRENGISRGATINKDELLFQIRTKEELRTKQVEDPDIRQMMEWKINGRPEWKTFRL